jgi:hypothetical protein
MYISILMLRLAPAMSSSSSRKRASPVSTSSSRLPLISARIGAFVASSED